MQPDWSVALLQSLGVSETWHISCHSSLLTRLNKDPGEQQKQILVGFIVVAEGRGWRNYSFQTCSHHKHRGLWMTNSAGPALEDPHEVQTRQWRLSPNITSSKTQERSIKPRYCRTTEYNTYMILLLLLWTSTTHFMSQVTKTYCTEGVHTWPCWHCCISLWQFLSLCFFPTDCLFQKSAIAVRTVCVCLHCVGEEKHHRH